MTTPTSEKVAIDHGRTEALVGSMVQAYAGFMTMCIGGLGARLGLFASLADGPATPAELAGRTATSERWCKEWAEAATCAGLVEHEARTGTFSLPAEHRPVLVDEASPVYLAPFFSFPFLISRQDVLGRVERAFRDGGGISQSVFGDEAQVLFEKFSGGWADHDLVQHWIPSIDGLEDRLRSGIDVADIGSGGGRALIRLAQSFPASRFTGFDAYAGAVNLARAKAAESGLSSRLSFLECDASTGLQGEYDVITICDVVHEVARPSELLRAARQALRPGGVVLVKEANVADDLASNIGPLGVVYYGASLLACLPVSIGEGGEGTGSVFPESKLRALALPAGFDSVRPVFRAPFYAVYELRAG